MQEIFTRKSIRKYKDIPVSEEIVSTLLKAAMQAPSAGNQQPWEFIVIRDKQTLTTITTFHPYSQMLLYCDVAIVICGNTNNERFPGYWIQDCSAATQNILLQAESTALGAVWLGVYPQVERVTNLQTLLHLPTYVIPLAIVPIGYPDEVRSESNRYNQKAVHYERWEE